MCKQSDRENHEQLQIDSNQSMKRLINDIYDKFASSYRNLHDFISSGNSVNCDGQFLAVVKKIKH